MTIYNILLKAKVENANAFQGYYVGVPSPMTAISFSEYLKLEILKEFKKNEYLSCLDEYDTENPINSFDFAITKNVSYGFDGLSFRISEGHEKFSNSAKITKLDTLNTPIVDVRRFSSDFFVNFQLELKSELDGMIEIKYLNKILFSILNRSNFSGGKIFEVYEKNIIIVDNSEFVKTYSTSNQFFKKNLLDNKHIWFIIEQFSKEYNDGYEIAFPEMKNGLPFDKLLTIIKKKKKHENNKVYDNILDGYYIPSLLGYRLLDSFKEPSGRFKYKNTYGEPILGVVRCRSINSYLSSNESFYEVFWNFSKNIETINTVAKNKIN